MDDWQRPFQCGSAADPPRTRRRRRLAGLFPVWKIKYIQKSFCMHILHVPNICLLHLTHCCRLGLFYRPVFSFFAQKATEPPVAIFGGERLYFAKEGQPSRITAPTGEENARIPANFQRNRAALRGRPARVHDFLRRHRRDHGLASGRHGAGRRSHHQEAAPIRNLAASPGMHRLHGVDAARRAPHARKAHPRHHLARLPRDAVRRCRPSDRGRQAMPRWRKTRASICSWSKAPSR